MWNVNVTHRTPSLTSLITEKYTSEYIDYFMPYSVRLSVKAVTGKLIELTDMLPVSRRAPRIGTNVLVAESPKASNAFVTRNFQPSQPLFQR